MKLKVLDLFSGIGGFSLGLERTGGFETVAFCEIDPFCQKVLKKHWPNVPIFDDVRTLNYDGTVDVITGGFPCQDVSVAGSAWGVNIGIAGERSGLWKSYKSLIQQYKPQFAIIENVPALWSKGLDVVLEDLYKIGYDAEWHFIPASAVGSPQNRDRIWIVAYASGQRVQRLLEGSHISKAGSGWACRQEDLQQVYNAPTQPGKSWPQPMLCGSDSRVPGWMDRIRSLGNSVVPQIPGIIGHAILGSSS
jgi:DNA (cytosine-5)-methyltransferase 1